MRTFVWMIAITICGKAMAPRPDDRYLTAEALRADSTCSSRSTSRRAASSTWALRSPELFGEERVRLRQISRRAGRS